MIRKINNLKNYYYEPLNGNEINSQINIYNYCIKEFESNPIFTTKINDLINLKIRDISLEIGICESYIKNLKNNINSWIYPNDIYFLISINENSYLINKNNNLDKIMDELNKNINLKKKSSLTITSLYEFNNLKLLNPLVIIQDIYFIDKSYSLNKLNGGLIFESELTNNILEFVKNKEKKNQLKKITYGDGLNNQRFLDEKIRKCNYFDSKIIINLDIPSLSDKIHFLDSWEYLEYDENGIFDKHMDRKRNKYHHYTVLLYPPYNLLNIKDDTNNELIGGDLILYPFGENSENFSIKIKIDKKKWICVIFPINITHESTIVSQGSKCLFKGVGCGSD